MGVSKRRQPPVEPPDFLQFRQGNASRGPHMRRQWLLVLALSVAVSGCGASIFSPGISELNSKPNKYYQQSVSFKARISRIQSLEGETLLEVADAQEHRIFVRAPGSIEAGVDEWVKIEGTLVPEARVGGKLVYDIVMADSVTSARAPILRNLF
jgi:hypothetical protein